MIIRTSKILVALLVVGSLALAKPESERNYKQEEKEWKPTFATEITFTSRALEKDINFDQNVMTEANLKALDAAYKKLKKLKGKGEIESVQYKEGGDKYGSDYVKVRYKGGWGFDVTLDPGVLEVILQPFTSDKLDKKFENKIQKHVFNLMNDIGLEPRIRGEDAGGGHVHVGMQSTFGTDAVRLFRNQVVDFANHPEIGSGAMDDDLDNAKPLIKMKKKQRQELEKWVRRVDEGHFKTVRQAATALVKDVVLEGKEQNAQNILKGKYWAQNFLRMAYLDTWDTLKPNRSWDDYMVWAAFDDVELKARTLEYRAVRAPRNASEMVRNIRLFEARLNFLRDLDRKIPLHPKFVEGVAQTTKEKVERFYKWVTDSGLNPMDYVYSLPSMKKEMPDFKAWHRHYLDLAEGDGYVSKKSMKRAYCGFDLVAREVSGPRVSRRK